MPLGNTYILSAVVLPSGQISQIVDKDVSHGIEHIFDGASGTVDPDFAAIMEQKPQITFTTTAIGTALGLCGINGLAISTATDFYFQRVSQGGTRDNTNAIKMTFSKGMVVPTRLRASHKQTARLTYTMYAISADGVTAPLSIATGQTVPTINAVSELYVVGPCSLNGAGLSSLTDLDVAFNIDVESLGSDGEGYPTFCGIRTRRPEITPSGYDMTAMSTFGMNGLALTGWIAYLRKINKGGVRVANGTAQHIKLFGTTGMFAPKRASGTSDREASGEWCIYPTNDGSNPIIQQSLASAIS